MPIRDGNIHFREASLHMAKLLLGLSDGAAHDSRGTKEMMQPCPLRPHAISLVASSGPRRCREMMQPCLTNLHVISVPACMSSLYLLPPANQDPFRVVGPAPKR